MWGLLFFDNRKGWDKEVYFYYSANINGLKHCYFYGFSDFPDWTFCYYAIVRICKKREVKNVTECK